MQSSIASTVPDIFTQRSVEFGNMSAATCIAAPVLSLISLILLPPFPINGPHCDAGTIILTNKLSTSLPVSPPSSYYKKPKIKKGSEM